MMKWLLYTMIVVYIGSCLTGCGQTGALYLPSQPQQNAAPSADCDAH